jgi:hypothetical protein
MPTETVSRRSRGRPFVFSDDVLRQAAAFSYARRVRTRRGAQDLVYRKFAVVAIELFSEAYPEQASKLSWFLAPTMRHTLLSELGRIAQPRSNVNGVLSWSEHDVTRLIHAALEIAEARPPTKAGVAMIRDLRRRYRSEVATAPSSKR